MSREDNDTGALASRTDRRISARKLPSELVAEILCDLRAIEAAQGPRLTGWLSDPMLVCRAWREIIVQTPYLWTYIDTFFDKTVNLLLERSKTFPLTVVLRKPRRTVADQRQGAGPDSSFQNVVQSIERAMSRVWSLKVECDIFRGLLASFGGRGRTHLPTDHIADSLSLGRSLWPELTHLSLAHATLPNATAMFTDLSSLCLQSVTFVHGVTVADIQRILLECPLLENLFLADIRLDSGLNAASLNAKSYLEVAAHLQSLHLRSDRCYMQKMLTIFSQPALQLRCLELDSGSEEPVEADLTGLFSGVTPALVKVSLTGLQLPRGVSFLKHLVEFSLCLNRRSDRKHSYVLAQDIALTLRANPGLKSLSLKGFGLKGMDNIVRSVALPKLSSATLDLPLDSMKRIHLLVDLTAASHLAVYQNQPPLHELMLFPERIGDELLSSLDMASNLETENGSSIIEPAHLSYFPGRKRRPGPLKTLSILSSPGRFGHTHSEISNSSLEMWCTFLTRTPNLCDLTYISNMYNDRYDVPLFEALAAREGEGKLRCSKLRDIRLSHILDPNSSINRDWLYVKRLQRMSGYLQSRTAAGQPRLNVHYEAPDMPSQEDLANMQDLFAAAQLVSWNGRNLPESQLHREV